MVTLVRVVQTAMACPSQWDAWDADGNYYYLRYRSGCGEVRQYEDENWVDAPWRDDVDKTEPGWGLRANPKFIGTVADFMFGHPLDGFIGLEDFCALAGLSLAPDLMRTGYGQHIMDELVKDGVPFGQAEGITTPWRELDE